LEPARVNHVAGVDCRDVRALGRLDVYPVPESRRAEPRVHLGAERHDDPPLGRPREPPAKVAEPDTGRLDPTLWRRHLGQPSLPGLQLADKGFESAGGFGELARPALVVAHRHRARHWVVATQDERQRAALRVHPVHDPEASGERLLLASALPLEPHDLAAECGDVGLRPFDPGREPPDLRLLLPQALLDLLELGEQRRLAGPRGRGLLALLLQALLRLLALLLLALQRLVALLLPFDRPRQRHEHDEQQEDAGAGAGAPPRPVASG